MGQSLTSTDRGRNRGAMFASRSAGNTQLLILPDRLSEALQAQVEARGPGSSLRARGWAGFSRPRAGAGTQPELGLTHRGGPAHGPVQHWCTVPPARSAPPLASPSCRRPRTFTSETGLCLPPVPCPRVHRAAPPDRTNRSPTQLDRQTKAIDDVVRCLRFWVLGLSVPGSVESPDSRFLYSKDKNTRGILSHVSEPQGRGSWHCPPFSTQKRRRL